MSNEVKIGVTAGVVIVGACILLKAIPLLILGGFIYFLYLSTKNEKSIKEDSTEECRSGNQKK